MRNLVLFGVGALAPFALTLPSQAQVAAAAGAGITAAAPHIVAAVPAVLTSAVSSGSAHVGQAVIAKLANPSMLSDGSKLAAGTQLLGHITQAIPVSKGFGKSSLGMVFDHFKAAGGQSLPLDPARLTSLGSGQAGGGQARTQESGGASAETSTGGGAGGLLGGVTNTLGSTVNGVTGAVSGTVNGLVGTVTSLPGVLLQSTGTLVAQGQNVTVPAGTRVSLSTSASAEAGSR